MDTRIFLVRHGDVIRRNTGEPILNENGWLQAEAAARCLAGILSGGRCVLISSPRTRAVETAQALAKKLGAPIEIDVSFGEAPVPIEFEDNVADYTRGKRWSSIDHPMKMWRDQLVASLESRGTDTIIVTHFLAINAAVSSRGTMDDVVAFDPPKGSVTSLTLKRNALEPAIYLYSPPQFERSAVLGS